MHDTSWLLERAGERFDMLEPAMDRLLRRRDRRQRRKQLAAAGLALAISVLGVGVALVALRTEGPAVPGSGGPEDPTGGGGSLGSLVLPSVAIWAAIGALAVVVLVLGRLRERPAGPPPPATSPDGHGPSAAPVPATPPPPAKAKGQGRREEAMATHVERYPERHAARNVWVTVGVLALLALAIGTGVLIGRATVEEPAPAPEPLGLAPAATVAVVDANIAALNAADEDALAATFTTDAVFTDDIAGIESVGVEEIVDFYLGDVYPGDWDLRRTSEVVQMGDFASSGFAYASGSGIAVWEFSDDGKIAHQWVMGFSM